VEVVEAQVEAGARADLEQPQRQAVALPEVEEPEGERRAAADLVRLARLRHERLQALALFVHQAVKGGPGAVDAGAAAGGRVVGGQARGFSRQHQPVDRRHQPQREGVGAQVRRVEGLDEPEDRPARRRVLGRALEQVRVERRAHRRAIARLVPQQEHRALSSGQGSET
jgi:hypothetical protein